MELPAGGAEDGVLLQSRSAFARHCTVSGAVLLVIGVVGIARWWTMSVGLLLLWMAAMVVVITHEDLEHEDLETWRELDGGGGARPSSPVASLTFAAVGAAAPSSPADAASNGARAVAAASPVSAARSVVAPASRPMVSPRASEAPDRTTVRFWLPAAVAAERVFLVGDFNGWSTTETPMRRSADGFAVEVLLRRGATYRYRYLLDDGRWENDWSAHRYAANEFGSDDSVLDVPVHGDVATIGRDRAGHGG